MATDDPKQRESGVRWASQDIASSWQSGAAARGQSLGPATELMLDLAGVTVGSHVLDLGAGTGDQTLVAARRIGPGGSILATDVSAAMIDAAREAFQAADLHNVTAQVMDAQQLDLEHASFDAVIARLSLQFVPDVQRALSEVRRVLKPGRRFAAMVWGATEKNPFRALPQAIASRRLGRPFPAPGPGMWALHDQARLADACRQAGFQEVEVRPVPVVWSFPSLDDALRTLEGSLPPFIQMLAALSETDRATVWAELRQAFEPFVGPEGFEAPGEALIVGGTA